MSSHHLIDEAEAALYQRGGVASVIYPLPDREPERSGGESLKGGSGGSVIPTASGHPRRLFLDE